MNAPKEPVPLLSKCHQHQQQLNNVFSQISEELTLNGINHLKTQILLLSDWLFELTEKNSDAVLAQALRFNKSLLPHTNKAFLAAILATKFSRQLHFHGQHAKLFIRAALTMNIDLLINNVDISAALEQHQKLTKEQFKKYQQYPLVGAQLLNKYKILDKSALHWVLGHKELLDGHGFPAGLKHHNISTNMQILGLVSRFAELALPRKNKAPIKTKQILAYLVQHQHQFNISLINQLISLIDKPLPSLIYQLDKKNYAFITDTDLNNTIMTIIPFSIDEGKLTLAKEAKQETVDYQRHYMVPPSIISEQIIAYYLQEYIHEPLEDISDQTQRLKPSDDLSLLLSELGTHLPDTNEIQALITQQPTLSKRLIEHLQQQYPDSQFNNSYHAIQMAGFSQVLPLLSRLALDSQLSHFEFLGCIDLRQKISCAVNISQVIGQYCHHVLPNELAMFTLLNLAPLYLEHKIINRKLRQPVSFKQCTIHHGFSLAGIDNTAKQPKLTIALAKIWAPKKSLINALAAISQPALVKTKKEREFIAGFELAIYITHSIFHDFNLYDEEHDSRLTAICRDLKIKPPTLKQLQHTALAHHPLCEL